MLAVIGLAIVCTLLGVLFGCVCSYHVRIKIGKPRDNFVVAFAIIKR